MKIIINNMHELKNFSNKISELASSKKEFFILLSGDLGAGKTTLSKMIISNLGIKDNVTSPTFAIMNQYENNDMIINHMDAYRLSDNSENDMYFEEFHQSINIIEWYENLNFDFSNKDHLKIEIKIISENTREIEIDKEI